MALFDRRKFLLGAAAVALPSYAAEPVASLAVYPGRPLARIPARYIGLSYESSQLAEPEFFSPRNRSLIALFQRLSSQGVLRLGGNSSDFTWWKASPDALAPPMKRPDGPLDANWMPHELVAVTPRAIDNLVGFLDETGWKLIYGLNLGSGAPERAAAEAAYVAGAMGRRLEYFQIGNEPDLYGRSNNRLRPPAWGFDDYLAEWTGFAQAVRARVPSAVFGGPDVAGDSEWIARFAARAPAQLGAALVTLSGHYYAAGPPDDPRVTIERLLARDAGLASRIARIAAIAAQARLPFRMTEGNSCYRGGKPGISDAFASALWAAGFALMTAQAGYAGVNFHGGGARQIRAALGGHLPSAARGNSFYTPIAGGLDEGFTPRPVFYGLLFAGQFAGAEALAADFDPRDVNAAACAARSASGIRVALLNQDAVRDLRVKIDPGSRRQLARVWRLTGPALDATGGVTLAGRSIAPDASWSPQEERLRPDPDGRFPLDLPRASAALVFFD